jgi:DNA-binding GntR family transcriptional regulator
VDRYQTKSELAYRHLLNAIVIGTIKPSERIDMDSVACEIGMSRMPIRQALVRLTAEGLVVGGPHESVRAAPLALADMRDLYSARILLEPLLAKNGTRELQVPVMDRIAQHLADTETAVRNNSLDDFLVNDWLFHNALYKEANLALTLNIANQLRKRSDRYIARYVSDPASLRRSQVEHEQIFKKVQEGDSPRVAKLVRRHIANGQRQLEVVLRESTTTTQRTLSPESNGVQISSLQAPSVSNRRHQGVLHE